MRNSALLVLWSAVSLWSQADVSSLRGTIRDATGAVVPGVQVRVTNLQTNVARAAIASENGDYELSTSDAAHTAWKPPSPASRHSSLTT
jgi:hypothetical protein